MIFPLTPFSRNLDMIMLSVFNGIERTEENFRKIFKEADERFVVESLTRPTDGAMAVMSASWKSSD